MSTVVRRQSSRRPRIRLVNFAVWAPVCILFVIGIIVSWRHNVEHKFERGVGVELNRRPEQNEVPANNSSGQSQGVSSNAAKNLGGDSPVRQSFKDPDGAIEQGRAFAQHHGGNTAFAAVQEWRSVRSAELKLQGCPACCTDGVQWGVQCLDVELCARSVSPGGKYAFAYAQVGRPGWPFLTNLPSMSVQAAALRESGASVVDIILLMPPADAAQMGPRQMGYLSQYGVKVLRVNWTIPPTLKWWPSHWWPGKPDGWCGPQDLVRLHVLGLDDYDGVAFYDQDIEFQGDVTSVLKCASTGRFLSASGGVGEPLNVGFFAVRPDRRLLRAAELFAEGISFDKNRGWGGAGFAPSRGYFVGAECGQGYFLTLMYHRTAQARRAFAAAGLEENGGVRAAQIDRCIWNYQTGYDCGASFKCGQIRAHHKPNGPSPTSSDCLKLAFSSLSSPLSNFPKPPEAIPKEWENLGCSTKYIEVGASCKCSQPFAHIKRVEISEGNTSIAKCDQEASNAAGDRFAVSIESPTTLVVKRTDAPSCWCDPELSVRCCIAASDARTGETRSAQVVGSKLVEKGKKHEEAIKESPRAAEKPDVTTQSALMRRTIGSWHMAPPPRSMGCPNCCHDGRRWGVKCYDSELDECAARAKPGGKFAFVYAQVGRPGWPFLTFVDKLAERAHELSERSGGVTDIVLMMLKKDIASLDHRHKALIQKYDVKVVEIPWSLPPALKWWPDNWWPGKSDGWCGPQDLVRMHVFGLDEYDAAAFYDQDIEHQADVSSMMLCASTGVFISTSGGVGEPLNVGFFALKPDRRLLRAAELFAEGANFSKTTGWAGSGFLPSGGYFVGAECGQGYVHSLVYQDNLQARKVFKQVGLPRPGTQSGMKAVQIDRCVWNYQGGSGCPARFDCNLVRVHHKPTSKPTGFDCGKLQFTPRGFPVASPMSKHDDVSRCSIRPVDVGPNCKCDGANNIKTVEVKGFIVVCQGWVKTDVGDEFTLAWKVDSESQTSLLTATRYDAESCWCAELQVQCCIENPPQTGKKDYAI